MSITILEVLENAEYNLNDGSMPQIQVPMAKEQLSNAIKALNNGYNIDDDYNEDMLTNQK